MKIYEYHEGSKARENFDKGMKALFRIPKGAAPVKKKARKQRAKKRDASRESGSEARSL
jgi:hypothetical protein